MASARRRVLRVLVLVLGVAALLVAADRAVAWYVETETETAIESDGAQVRGVQIDIHGFPFLTQLASGRIGHVTGRLDFGTFGELTVGDVSLDARDVVPRDPYRARVARADGLLGLESVQAIVSDAVGTAVAVERAGSGEGEALDLSMPVLGVDLTATITPTVVDGTTLGVDVQRISLGGGSLDVAELPGGMADQLTGLRVPVDLPDGVALTGVAVEPGGLRLRLEAADVALADLAASTEAGTERS